MYTRIQNTTLAIAVVIVVLLGWIRSSSLRSTALASDARPAAADSDSAALCGCNGTPTAEADPVHPIVPTPGEDLAETARMHRMSANLLKPQLALSPEAARGQRSQWAERFRKEGDPLLRQEIVTEMVQLDDADTLDTMLGLFDAESHAGVRDQIILIVGYLRATAQDMPKVCAKLMSAYDRGNDAHERARILDIVSNIPAAESVECMRKAFTSPWASTEDRANAAAGLFKLAPRVEVDAALVAAMTDRLKHDAQASPTPRERSLAVTSLAAPGQDNKAFFRKVLESESDPALRRFLVLAAQERPTR